jgi:Flp pilus assembly protein TadG
MVARHKVPKGQRGVALVELALVAPIIVIVLFGILEFGMIIYSKGVVTNASREGARFGVVLNSPRRTSAEIEAKVRDYLGKSGFSDPVTISVTGAGAASGTPMAVQVTYSYHFQVLPNFIESITGTLGLTAETAMLME